MQVALLSFAPASAPGALVVESPDLSTDAPVAAGFTAELDGRVEQRTPGDERRRGSSAKRQVSVRVTA